MALSPQLLQFKSSGVYRLEFDKSQSANIPAETLRLVVGHSKKGPYNSPVLVSTVEQFIEVFGSIDKNLEKRGMFFHRSALAALTRGPILALNLAGFEATDVIDYVAPVSDASDASATESTGDSAYYNYFNTEKFWSPSDEALNDVVGTSDNNLLRFANIKQDNITVIVRKAQDVKSFDILAREWYGESEVPAFMNAFDYVSDFMVDIFVFKGSFDAAAMSTDPVYGEFFTTAGLKKDKLDEFANLRQVSLIAKYTGSMIPGFTDKEGNNLYIETIVNSEARRTGLFSAVLEDKVLEDLNPAKKVNKADLVGHSYDDSLSYDLLSYSVGAGKRAYDIDSNFTYDKSSGAHVTYTAGASVSYNALPTITFPAEDATATPPVAATTTSVSTDTLTVTGFDISTEISVGDFLQGDTGYVEVLSVNATTVVCSGNINAAYDGIDTSAAADTITIYEEVTGAVPSFDLVAGDYILGQEPDRMVKVLRVAKQVVGSDDVYTVYVSGEAKDTTDMKGYKSFEDAVDHYKTFVIEGASIADQTIQDCLDAVTLGSGLANSLVDKDAINFRYIVDTFASYDNGSLLNKVQLSSLAKERQNASAILNAPFISEFKKSTNPSFTDANGTFNINFIATGGNLDKNPTSLFALPGINDGANYAFYYTALVARENNKDIIVPAAGYVSNNFIDKYIDSSPWAIVAGPRRGVISGAGIVGAEYAFDKSDRDILEPFGINPIVFQRGAGLTILGNKTAQQSVQSALSSAHVREVLIYIQDGLAAILKDYVFEFNTPQTRLEIKTLADSFMESVKADAGVYEFKNVIDTTNNTNEVIDANIGILDTFVEPVKGLEIVVQRTTVLNTGEIASGNFS